MGHCSTRLQLASRNIHLTGKRIRDSRCNRTKQPDWIRSVRGTGEAPVALVRALTCAPAEWMARMYSAQDQAEVASEPVEAARTVEGSSAQAPGEMRTLERLNIRSSSRPTPRELRRRLATKY